LSIGICILFGYCILCLVSLTHLSGLLTPNSNWVNIHSMLAIRLQRIGKKKQPTYRLVVSEKSKDLYGDHLEILGHYNPVAKPKVVNIKAERIKHWLAVGAQASATVHNLLVSQGVISSRKVAAWRPKKKKADKSAEVKAEPAAVDKQ
jgi:small subunit ribosomal protein S16